MFIVKIHYGLGNQLFQYAFGRSLSLTRKIPFSLDLHFYSEQKKDTEHPRVYQLNNFSIKEDLATDEKIGQLLRPSMLNRGIMKLENLLRPYFKRRTVYERTLSYDENMWKVKDDVYLAGYWQDLRYFEKHEDVIREDLKFRSEPQGLNKEYADRINTSESVAIHVRRGDYLTDAYHKEHVGVADMNYYRNAIQFLLKRIKEPRYFVFTDDPVWVRNNFSLDVSFELIDHNDQEHAYEDLRLMSMCKHQVISNSSFGWWGGWLNNRENRIVIAPEIWRKNGPDMYKPGNWIVL